MDAPISSPPATPRPDQRIDAILDIVARETKIDRDRLQLDAHTDDLGIGSLDLTLVVFEIESHFGIELPFAPEPPVEKSMTVGMLVDHVLQFLDAQANPSVSG
ncbi:MAG: phosphopantetheine-binding protein [Burkholderiaceae bacterium]